MSHSSNRSTSDPISLGKRLLLFGRVPFAAGVALSLVSGSGLLGGRDAALLGLPAGASPASWGIAAPLILVATLLPGILILWKGVERGIVLAIAVLGLYLFGAAIVARQIGIVPPVLAFAAGWYLSQILGIGWRPHSGQDVRHLLPVVQRGVFVSYRRSLDEVTARLLKHELAARGFDVFLDVDDLGPSPRFDERLLEEIETRYNFVLLLSPGSLDRCREEGDWVRLELEHALATRRRVVPVTRAGFDLGEVKPLPASLGTLPMHNAIAYSSVHHDAVVDQLVAFLSAPPGSAK